MWLYQLWLLALVLAATITHSGTALGRFPRNQDNGIDFTGNSKEDQSDNDLKKELMNDMKKWMKGSDTSESGEDKDRETQLMQRMQNFVKESHSGKNTTVHHSWSWSTNRTKGSFSMQMTNGRSKFGFGVGTGPACVESCKGKKDGDYQSCSACNVYVSCTGQNLVADRPCPLASATAHLVWDDNLKRCNYTSDTCQEKDPLSVTDLMSDSKRKDLQRTFKLDLDDVKSNTWCTGNDVWVQEQTACRALPSLIKGCMDIQADIIFLVDASGSVGRRNYRNTKKLLQYTTRQFNVNKGNVRMAAIVFSKASSLEFGLSDHNDSVSLHTAFGNLPYPGGKTRTDLALTSALQHIITSRRDGVPMYVVTITDGKSTEPKLTEQAAGLLLAVPGVVGIAVGVGSGVDKKELAMLTSDPKRLVVRMDSYTALLGSAAQFANVVCKEGCSSGKCNQECPEGTKQLQGLCVKDHCAEDPCQGSSVCEQHMLGRVCTCRRGQVYSKKQGTCIARSRARREDPCSVHECKHHGTSCVEKHGRAVCACPGNTNLRDGHCATDDFTFITSFSMELSGGKCEDMPPRGCEKLKEKHGCDSTSMEHLKDIASYCPKTCGLCGSQASHGSKDLQGAAPLQLTPEERCAALKIMDWDPKKNTCSYDANKACQVIKCGTNAKCAHQGNAVRCVCENGFVGNPYRGCEKACYNRLADCGVYAKRKWCGKASIAEACPAACNKCDYKCPSTMAPAEGETCEAVSQCSTGDFKCSKGAVCIDTDVAYVCTCPYGQVLNISTDQCVDKCEDTSSKCRKMTKDCFNPDEQGKIARMCPKACGLCGSAPPQAGFYLDRMRRPQDINECEKNGVGTRHCDAKEGRCINTDGGYICEYNAVESTCRDTHGERACQGHKHRCTKSKGMRYGCAATCGYCKTLSMENGCPSGYTKGVGDICEDIDECATGAQKCPKNAVCVNRPGSSGCEGAEEGTTCITSKDGVSTCGELKVCRATGDPHYTRFDGQTYNFQGTCKYVMVRPKEGQLTDKPYFSVDAQNRPFRKSLEVASVQRVEVTIGDSVITMEFNEKDPRRGGPILEVDGISPNLPYKDPNGLFTITPGSRSPVISTLFGGPTVSYDGNTRLEIQLPSLMAGKVEGLCGTMEEDDGKYTLPDGTSTDDPIEFGNQWIAEGPQELICKAATAEQNDDCTDELMAKVKTVEYCGLLSDPQGPFATCHEKVNVNNYVSDCEMDMCAMIDDRDTLCKAYLSYATACRDADILLQWREQANCPLECGENEEMSYKAPVCQPSCVDLTPECEHRTVESCVCKTGFIRSNTECVPNKECGCYYQGVYLLVGESHLNSDCTEKWSCDLPMKISTRCVTCPFTENATCADSTCHCDDFSKTGCEENCPFTEPKEVENDAEYNPLLEPLPEMEAPDIPPNQCVDLGNDCSKDKCNDNVKSMQRNCALTCGYCHPLRPDGCMSGYQLTKEGGCLDINECEARKNPCPKKSVCTNTYPGYTCSATNPKYFCMKNEENDKWTCERKGQCKAVGDPHYTQFDGFEFGYQGTCPGNVAESTADPSELTYFKVVVKNYNRGRNTDTSFAKYVDTSLDGITIRLTNGDPLSDEEFTPIVYVTIDNGHAERINTLPWKYGHRVEIRMNGDMVEVSTDFGLLVSFYPGKHWVFVYAPQSYRNNMQGICGNYDGNKDNDLVTKEGNKTEDIVEFAESWLEGEPGTVCNRGVVSELCKTKEDREAAQARCALMKDEHGPVAKALSYVDIDGFMGDCIDDMCQSDNPDVTLCQNLEAVMKEARISGLIHDCSWREAANCPFRECPEHSHYKCVGCQPTCSSYDASCQGDEKEACQCDEGYIWRNNKCIPRDQCGCQFEGTIYQVGETWFGVNCSSLYSCEKADNVSTEIVQSYSSCPSSAYCKSDEGKLGCYCMGEDGIDKSQGTCEVIDSKQSTIKLSNDPGWMPWHKLIKWGTWVKRPDRVQAWGEPDMLDFGAEWDGGWGMGGGDFSWDIGLDVDGEEYTDDMDDPDLFDVEIIEDEEEETIEEVEEEMNRNLMPLANKKCPMCLLIDVDTNELVDIDECTDGSALCKEHSQCVNVFGNYHCVCDDGYIGNGKDECLALVEDTSDDCTHYKAVGWCEDRAERMRESCPITCGFSVLTCPRGYMPNEDRTACIDIDECAEHLDECDEHAQCYNIEGGFECSCYLGYDFNYLDNTCGTGCRDRRSSSFCSTNKELCWHGTEHQTRLMNLYCTETCQQCEMPFCKKGTQLTTDGKCVDINECSDKKHNCPVNSMCENLETEQKYRCLCETGFTGVTSQDGRLTCIPDLMCSARAEPHPHINTFDNEQISFEGTCSYTLSQTREGVDLMPYHVIITSKAHKGAAGLTWMKSVTIIIDGYTIVMNQDHSFTVNGEQIDHMPWFSLAHDITVHTMLKGEELVVVTRVGLKVSLDKAGVVVLAAPNKYRSKVQGLCGNMDSSSDNDLVTKEGEHTKSGATIGTSWMYAGNNDVCKPANEVQEECPAEVRPMIISECSILERTDGSFSPCEGMIYKQQTRKVCEHQLCRSFTTEENILMDICHFLDTVVDQCSAHMPTAQPIRFRSRAFCPGECTDPSSHYEQCTSACPNTCQHPDSEKTCTQTCVSGCVCDPGYVWQCVDNNCQDKRCVKPKNCGCTDAEDNWYPLMQKVGAKRCGIQHECLVSGSAPVSRELKCSENEVCITDSCQCKQGYERHEDTAECEAIPTVPSTTTTKAPVTTTKAPVTTTKAPVTTTNEPLTTTKAPATSTEEPTSTTQEPTTTLEPITTTAQKPTTKEEPTTTVEPKTTTAPKPTTKEQTGPQRPQGFPLSPPQDDDEEEEEEEEEEDPDELTFQPSEESHIPPPEEDAEAEDDKYFAIKSKPVERPRPPPMGMASGLIADSDISATSHKNKPPRQSAAPWEARPTGNGWEPEDWDTRPCITINLRSVVQVHGFGTLGSAIEPIYVKAFHVYTSMDGHTYRGLLEKSTIDNPEPERKMRTFLGNVKGRNVWKRHCLHRYYEEPVSCSFIRFCPIEVHIAVGLRVELYGWRGLNDNVILIALKSGMDRWTQKPTGCRCYFDHSRTDCACCESGGCQCYPEHPHQCVQCGYGTKCGDIDPTGVNQWTESMTGCKCPGAGDDAPLTCACCKTGDNIGCLCPTNPKECVQCGQELNCGQREDIFGPSNVCVPKTCSRKKRKKRSHS